MLTAPTNATAGFVPTENNSVGEIHYLLDRAKQDKITPLPKMKSADMDTMSD